MTDLKLKYIQKQLSMTNSEFYWFLKLINHRGIITTTDIINNGIKYKEALDE